MIAVLKHLLVLYGRPRYVRSDNGPELMAQRLLTCSQDQGITPNGITLVNRGRMGAMKVSRGPFGVNV